LAFPSLLANRDLTKKLKQCFGSKVTFSEINIFWLIQQEYKVIMLTSKWLQTLNDELVYEILKNA
jgi:hypothetical protein